MTDLPLLLAFIAAAAVLTVTPGVDTAIVLRSVTLGGRRPAWMAAIGIAAGCLTWGAAASLGLGAVLHASETAYQVLKIVGAAYLVWIGTRLLLRPRDSLDLHARDTLSRHGGEAFRRGLLTNLLNPKVGVFYVTFLPQFISVGAGVAAHSFLLAAIHVALTLAWFAILIAATAPLTRFLRRPAAVKAMDRLTGGIFVAFGARLVLSQERAGG